MWSGEFRKAMRAFNALNGKDGATVGWEWDTQPSAKSLGLPWLHMISDPYRWSAKEQRYAIYKSGAGRAIRRSHDPSELLSFALSYAGRHKLNVVIHKRDGTVEKVYYKKEQGVVRGETGSGGDGSRPRSGRPERGGMDV